MENPKDKAQHIHDKTLNEVYRFLQANCNLRPNEINLRNLDIDKTCAEHDIRSTYPQHDENYNYWHQVKTQLKQLLNQ